MKEKNKKKLDDLISELREHVDPWNNLNREIEMSFLDAISLKALYAEIQDLVIDSHLLSESDELCSDSAIDSETKIRTCIDRYYSLRMILEENIDESGIQKEIRKLNGKINESKSRVIKKGIIRSLVLKNLLMQFLTTKNI